MQEEERYVYLGNDALIILVMVSLLKLNLQYHFANTWYNFFLII